MGNNVSVAVDELSEELSELLEATSIASASTRDELYSFFDDGFDDDAEEIPETSGTKTPATMIESGHPSDYFTFHITPASDVRQRTPWGRKKEYSQIPSMVDEGYCSSENGDDYKGMIEMECGDEEEREALLPAKRFSWRETSPERCSLLFWEK